MLHFVFAFTLLYNNNQPPLLSLDGFLRTRGPPDPDPDPTQMFHCEIDPHWWGANPPLLTMERENLTSLWPFAFLWGLPHSDYFKSHQVSCFIILPFFLYCVLFHQPPPSSLRQSVFFAWLFMSHCLITVDPYKSYGRIGEVARWTCGSYWVNCCQSGWQYN